MITARVVIKTLLVFILAVFLFFLAAFSVWYLKEFNPFYSLKFLDEKLMPLEKRPITGPRLLLAKSYVNAFELRTPQYRIIIEVDSNYAEPNANFSIESSYDEALNIRVSGLLCSLPFKSDFLDLNHMSDEDSANLKIPQYCVEQNTEKIKFLVVDVYRGQEKIGSHSLRYKLSRNGYRDDGVLP